MKSPRHSARRPSVVVFAQAMVRWFFRIVMMLVYRIRVHGLKNYPDDDRMLVCANHQGFLDPLVLGVVCPRPVNYLARKTLFRFKPLAAFITFNDAIPIDREATGIEGVKETLKRLKRGETVVMFPEGTRTKTGELNELMPGFSLLARRSRAPLMPIGIAGSFEAYPPGQAFPRRGIIHAVMGEPIPFEVYSPLTDQEATRLMQTRLKACCDEARRRRNEQLNRCWSVRASRG